MRWHYWLIDLPAKVVDVWFTFYYVLLTMLCVACFVMVVLVLVLDRFGVRWGW